jgi:D-3-phosphoglycerate dehydrogenase
MKILISDPLHEDGIKIFRDQGFEVEVNYGLSPDDLNQAIKGVDGLVIRSATKVTPELLDAADALKVVGRAGTGLDNVDIPAATKKGVIVMNTPGQNSNAAAELAVGHMFALARHIARGHAGIKQGKWEKKKLKGRELKGKTVGIVGMGAIGSIVAECCSGLKMTPIGFDPFLDDAAIKERGAEPVGFEELIQRADFVTIHVPKTKETAGLFNAGTLAKMKEGSYLINCARGGIVDEDALCETLENGPLSGAALDVFEQEPLPGDSRIMYSDEVTCTPHLGASTYEAQVNVAVAVANQMSAYLKGGEPEFAVNAPK